KDMKPSGWEFDNPLVSSTMTQRQVSRWNAILGTTRFNVGDKLTKDMAAYWEVELSQISSKAITSYDVLMIHAPGLINLSPSEREKLQLFVDAGGTLWYDKATSQTIDGYNSFPVPFIATSNGTNPV